MTEALDAHGLAMAAEKMREMSLRHSERGMQALGNLGESARRQELTAMVFAQVSGPGLIAAAILDATASIVKALDDIDHSVLSR